MINIAMIGYSGSGKTTMARDISEEFNFTHIETGKLFSKLMQEETQKGRIIEEHISKGQLVPDDLALNLIESKIEENVNSKGIIFDGFPRTRKQAEFLEKKLQDRASRLDFAFYLKIKEEEAIKRTRKKLTEQLKMNEKDIKEISISRIQEQRDELKELKIHFNKENKLYEYDAQTSPQSVLYGIRKIIMRKIEE